MPLVSVIVTTYNRKDLLAETIQSILNQTFKDFELIIVDNFSNYDFLYQIKNLRNTKIKAFQHNNNGVIAVNRNYGLKHASGKYIAFCDDDDLWLSNKLEIQVEILNNNSNFGLVHSCCEIIDESGVLQNKIIGRPGSLDVKHGDVSMRMMGNWTLMMPTPLVRSEIIRKVGFFNEEIPPGNEDVEYWTRCSFDTEFYYIDKPLVQYREHQNNFSINKSKNSVLPLYLKKILVEKCTSSRITKSEFKKLLNFLCHAQIKTFNQNVAYTIKNLFILNPFWIFGSNNIKMLIFMLFFKK